MVAQKAVTGTLADPHADRRRINRATIVNVVPDDGILPDRLVRLLPADPSRDG
jgi:hypothetical protein